MQNLVRIITELVVKQTAHKAIRKITNLAAAISAIKTLKGIGPLSRILLPRLTRQRSLVASSAVISFIFKGTADLLTSAGDQR